MFEFLDIVHVHVFQTFEHLSVQIRYCHLVFFLKCFCGILVSLDMEIHTSKENREDDDMANKLKPHFLLMNVIQIYASLYQSCTYDTWENKLVYI